MISLREMKLDRWWQGVNQSKFTFLWQGTHVDMLSLVLRITTQKTMWIILPMAWNCSIANKLSPCYSAVIWRDYQSQLWPSERLHVSQHIMGGVVAHICIFHCIWCILLVVFALQNTDVLSPAVHLHFYTTPSDVKCRFQTEKKHWIIGLVGCARTQAPIRSPLKHHSQAVCAGDGGTINSPMAIDHEAHTFIHGGLVLSRVAGHMRTSMAVSGMPGQWSL